jgi:hypothetical protein
MCRREETLRLTRLLMVSLGRSPAQRQHRHLRFIRRLLTRDRPLSGLRPARTSARLDRPALSAWRKCFGEGFPRWPAIPESVVLKIGAFCLTEPAGMSLGLSTTRCASGTDGWECCAAQLGTCWDGEGALQSLGTLSFSYVFISMSTAEPTGDE